MKLPADCRYAGKAPTRRSIVQKIDNGEIACCRSAPSYWIVGGPTPLCQIAADQVYRFSGRAASRP